MKKNLLGVSLLTITTLYVFLAAIILLITIATGIGALIGIIASIVILIIQFLISPYITDLTMKWFYKVKFDYEAPEYLKAYINEIITKENMKMPRLGFIDDGAPNAFTYGHTKNDARIIITRGILDLLTEEEVKSVVGHELGHAVHYDMLFMTVAQLVPLVLYAIYEICYKSNNNSNNNDNNGKTAAIGLLAYILYIITNYIVLWLSRTREYYADSYSIESTKNPNSLASALVKIGYGLTTSNSENKRISNSNALGIFDSKTSKSLVVSSYDDGEISKDHIKNAMKWEQWNVWAKLYELNSTHPLISKRLLAISARSNEFGQEPYIIFDYEKTESYVDDFLIELLICFAPFIIIMLGIIAVIVVPEETMPIALSLTILLTVVASFIKFSRRHSSSNYKETTVRDLLSEVKVSGITTIPCSVEGEVIGRGDPGNIFSEDMTIKDKTGIIFLDYNQPLMIINKIYALFKNKDNMGKTIKVVGWYRRSPVPYIEIKDYEIDGVKHKIWTYYVAKSVYVIALVISIAFVLLSIL